MCSEDNVKRNKWKLGRIEELVRGVDGVVRGARVKTSNEKGVKGAVNRPIQKLYPLEIREEPKTTEGDTTEETDGPSSVPMTLDTLTSQLTPKSINENLSKKLNTPKPSSLQSGGEKKGDTSRTSRAEDGNQKSYQSASTTNRPRRNAGVLGEEQRRRVERT